MKTITKLLTALCLTLILGFLSPHVALADTFTLSGTITDDSNTAIDGSIIEILQPNTQTVVATTTSNSSGEYTVVLNDVSYDIKVTPPAGSNFSPVIAYDHAILSNNSLNFVLVPAGTVSISGHVKGPTGGQLQNQVIKLLSPNTNTVIASATTDSSGTYSLEVPSGNYDINIRHANGGNSLSLEAPQEYSLTVPNYSLTSSVIIDITIPAKQVDLHVQDASGSAVSNVTIGTPQGSGNNLSIGGNISNAYGYTHFGDSFDKPLTDAAGNVTLWLIPGNNYSFTATPPNGSTFLSSTTSNIQITNDSSQTITLQQPVNLTGHLYDDEGNPISNQIIKLLLPNTNTTVASVTTNNNGEYSLQATPGNYDITIKNPNGGNTGLVNTPQEYSLNVPNYELTQNTSLNLNLPVKKVDVHIEDSTGNAVIGAQVGTVQGSVTNLPLATDVNGSGYSAAGYSFDKLETNSSGDVTLWLFPANNYTISVTPPTGSGLQTKTASNTVISDDTSLTITMDQPITLTGTVYDSLGHPLSNQSIKLLLPNTNTLITSATTDASGEYSIQATAGNYDISIRQATGGNSLSLDAPQEYTITIPDYAINQSNDLDITLPLKKVDLHVQDVLGNSINDVEIGTPQGSSTNVSINGDITNAYGYSHYGDSFNKPSTNSLGDLTLWLLTGSNYTITATPPSGSIYNSFTLNNVSVTSNQSELISLQYAHTPPVTTATLSPNPNGAGEYSNPVTASLFATPTEGYTIANTYYKIDGGSQQTYAAPFTISGNGEHTITYWSVDNSGVTESHKNKTFIIATPTPTPTATPTPTPTYTVGFTTQGTTLSQGSHDYMNGSKYTTGSTGGNADSMSVYVGNIGNATHRNYQLSIYTNKTNGKPGTKVANTTTGTLTANSWNTLPITATLSANTTYWLMYNNNGQNDSVNNMYYSTGTSNMGAFAERTFGSWPTTFPTPDMGNWKYSIYVTYH